jgi:biopolymer transport protein ExbD
MDIMFIVLVFFIFCISQMAVHRGIKVDLPAAGGAKELGERIVVTVLPDDSLQLNGMSLPREELVSRIKSIVESGVELPVLISADRKASLGAGVELLGMLKAAGMQKVSFQVSGEGGLDGKR